METVEKKQIFFIADLHLSDSEPDLGALLTAFLHRHAADAAALYILGDLFDAWTGDDDDSRTAAEYSAAEKNSISHRARALAAFTELYLDLD